MHGSRIFFRRGGGGTIWFSGESPRPIFLIFHCKMKYKETSRANQLPLESRMDDINIINIDQSNWLPNSCHSNTIYCSRNNNNQSFHHFETPVCSYSKTTR